MGTAFAEGFGDYFATVAPSLQPGGGAWLHIPQLNDKIFTASSTEKYDPAVPGGYGEDNELSVMDILYQLTESTRSAQPYETPAQLYIQLLHRPFRIRHAFRPLEHYLRIQPNYFVSASGDSGSRAGVRCQRSRTYD